MIFGQIYWKILRAYVNIWSKNFLIKMQKNGNFNNQMEFRNKSNTTFFYIGTWIISNDAMHTKFQK